MINLRYCRFCNVYGITTVRVIEPHGVKIRTAYHCPKCGEALAVVWSKRKRGDKYAID